MALSHTNMAPLPTPINQIIWIRKSGYPLWQSPDSAKFPYSLVELPTSAHALPGVVDAGIIHAQTFAFFGRGQRPSFAVFQFGVPIRSAACAAAHVGMVVTEITSNKEQIIIRRFRQSAAVLFCNEGLRSFAVSNLTRILHTFSCSRFLNNRASVTSITVLFRQPSIAAL